MKHNPSILAASKENSSREDFFRDLEKNNMKEKAKEMRDRITSSNSYDEALSIIGEYVEITDQSSLDEEEYE